MTKKTVNRGKRWTPEDDAYLNEKWGRFTVDRIATILGRTRTGILKRAFKLNLGPSRQADGHVTLNELIKTLKVEDGWYCGTAKMFIKNGLPYQNKVFLSRPVKVVNINRFWKWAEEHKELIDWSKLEENLLGKEPEWVKERRTIDFYNFPRRQQPKWSKLDETMLKRYIEEGKNIDEISKRLNRSVTAIRRRCYDLYLPYPRVDREPKAWTKEEEALLRKLKDGGYNTKNIALKLERSEGSITNKIAEFKRKDRKAYELSS